MGLMLGLFCGGQMAWFAYLWAVLTITPYARHALISGLGWHTLSIYVVFPIIGIAMAAFRIARGVRARRPLRSHSLFRRVPAHAPVRLPRRV